MRSSTAVFKLGAVAAGLLLCEGLYRTGLFIQARMFFHHTRAVDLYLLGGSVAGGVPYSYDTAFGPIAARALGGEIAGRKIFPQLLEGVHNTIYDDAMILRKALRYRDRGNPGALLIYAGANESYFRSDLGRGFSLLRAAKRLAAPSLLASDLLLRLEDGLGWSGARDYPGYEAQLRLVVETALGAGLKIVLVTKTLNLAGREPDLSARDLAQAGPDAFAAAARGLALEREGRFDAALRHYAEAGRRHPVLARLFHHRGCRCQEALGRKDAARRCYERDAEPEICSATSHTNDIARRVAAAHRLAVVDTEALFRARAPTGVPGNEFFADAGHPNVDGHIVIGLAVARELSRLFGVPVTKTSFTPEEVLDGAGLTGAQRACALTTTGVAALQGFSGYPYPVQRLALARQSFERATALDGDNYAAWLGRGLVEEAHGAGDILGEADPMWFRTYQIGTVPCFKAYVPDGEIDALAARWRRAKVPEEIFAQAARLGGSRWRR